MRKTILALTASGAVAAFGATASLAVTNDNPPIFQSLDPASVESGTYATDPAHTLVEWRVSHFGFNDYFGLFGDAEGTLELDTENMANTSVDVRIPINSLAVVSSGLREHMLRPGAVGGAPDFFGPDADDARFVSTAIHQTSETTAHIIGDLTLNGPVLGGEVGQQQIRHAVQAGRPVDSGISNDLPNSWIIFSLGPGRWK